MKPIKCKIRLHGVRREILTGEFDSISSAKKWIEDCWQRPYTIVRQVEKNEKGEQINAPLKHNQ